MAVTGLSAAGALPVWSGSPHHAALPPLDLFADVRVLLSQTSSYPRFVVGLALTLGGRVVVLAALLGALDRSRLLRAAHFYAAALPLALIAGGFAFAGTTAVYSTFVWIGVVIAVVTVLVAVPRFWRAGGWLRTLPKVLVYLVALLVTSLVATLGTTTTRVATVWVSGALTAATIHWIGRDQGDVVRRRLPPVAGVVAVVAVTIGAVTVSPASPPSLVRARAASLFLVPGIGGSSGTSTLFHLDPGTLGFDCEDTTYFSYAGTGDGAPQREAQCPITSGAPYRAQDTRRPLDELVRSFRAQYAELEPPVVVVAHSQGGWVAAAALARLPPPTPPGALVLLGSFPGHRTSYAVDRGPGVVGTDLLELLTALLRRTDATSFHPRAPLARALLGTRGAVAATVQEALDAGVPIVTVTSAFDLPIMTDHRDLRGVTALCPVAVQHGDLPRSEAVLAAVREALDASVAPACGPWPRWPLLALSAFAVPAG
jgi:pimeloyl-ACP methyl ester carboxylesterase